MSSTALIRQPILESTLAVPKVNQATFRPSQQSELPASRIPSQLYYLQQGTQSQFNRLQTEKKKLQDELELVREGAIQAIVQKDETIEQLKTLIDNIKNDIVTLENNNYQYEIRINELETERNELQRTMERISDSHQNEMTQKDRVIYELGDQLDSLKWRLEETIASDRELNGKLEITERQNAELEGELMSCRIQFQKLKGKLEQYELVASCMDQQSTMGSSQISEIAYHQQLLPFNESIDFILVDQEKKYQDEIRDLKAFYENLIEEKEKSQFIALSSQKMLQSDCYWNEDLMLDSHVDERRSSIVSKLQEKDDESQKNSKTMISSVQSNGFSQVHFNYQPKIHDYQCSQSYSSIGRKKSVRAMMSREAITRKEILQEVSEQSENSIMKSQLLPTDFMMEAKSDTIKEPDEKGFSLKKLLCWSGAVLVVGGLVAKVLKRA